MIALEVDGIFSDDLADSVVYNNGSTDATIEGIIDYGAGGLNSKADHATIIVKKSDVPTPEYRQTFTHGSDIWYVAPDKDKGLTLEGDEYMWVIRIQKNERFSQWRQ